MIVVPLWAPSLPVGVLAGPTPGRQGGPFTIETGEGIGVWGWVWGLSTTGTRIPGFLQDNAPLVPHTGPG